MSSTILKLHVSGMHCRACILLTESEARELPYITRAKSDLASNTIDVEGDFADKSPEAVALALTEVMRPHGYSVSVERPASPAVSWIDFRVAIPVALGFIALFVILQKIGIVNLVTTSEVTYGTAFVIGAIASVSTCMAVVGGLVLSVSANYAKEGDKVKPQLYFHAARLVSFFVLGGAIGSLGSAFALGSTATFILSLAVAIILLLLGINLLDVFPWVKKMQPTLPGFIGRHVHALKNLNHTLTPALLGAATFFLPCGFTQSMQIYSLTTGSFTTGALTMSAFALGTLPVLALLSFSSLTIHKKAQSGIFFKTAGLVVIFFALLNLQAALVSAGIISPLVNI